MCGRAGLMCVRWWLAAGTRIGSGLRRARLQRSILAYLSKTGHTKIVGLDSMMFSLCSTPLSLGAQSFDLRVPRVRKICHRTWKRTCSCGLSESILAYLSKTDHAKIDRTKLYDVFAVSNTPGAQSSQSWCDRSSKDMPKDHVWAEEYGDFFWLDSNELVSTMREREMAIVHERHLTIRHQNPSSCALYTLAGASLAISHSSIIYSFAIHVVCATLLLRRVMPRQPHGPPRPLDTTIHVSETRWRTTKAQIAGIHVVPRA
jgi:hypothetical protein